MIPDEIQELVDRGALFVVNHSAGKDSQAMLIHLRRHIPARQLLLIHADLGEIEWPGNLEHIERYRHGLPLVIAHAVDKTGARKELLDFIERRGKFPSSQQRFCTSDWKRDPIAREVRRYLLAHPEFSGLVVNCMGMRAQESPDRAKMVAFERVDENCVARRVSIRTGRVIHPGREWFDWLPIHDLTKEEVFHMIRAAGEEPHPIYATGMTRLSCSFCIMASQSDLRTAAGLRPELYRRYVALEKRIGHTLSMGGRSLEDVTGIAA